MNTSMPQVVREKSLSDLLLRVTDAACIIAGFSLATYLADIVVDSQYALACAIAVISMMLIGEFTGVYRNWRGGSLHREIVQAELSWFYSLATLLILGYLTRYTDQIPRSAVFSGAVTIGLLLGLSRVALRWFQRWLRRQGYNRRRAAIVGVTELGIRLARSLEEAPELGLEVAGFFDDRPSTRTGAVPDDVAGRLGSLADLVRQARDNSIHRVYITLPLRAEGRIRDVLNRLADTTVSVYIVPDFFVFELLHSRWADINGLPAVSVFENPFYGVDGLVKRFFDVVLASLLLAAGALPMAIIATIIRFTSPGPIFFRQRRYGLDGREILVWKFRSMRVCEDGPEVRQATKDDPRVTPFGAFLRRTSLDELPQLFNVLAGSMSLVGPRPHASAHNEQYRKLIPGYMLRHKVKPGITGLAQVLGFRGEVDSVDTMAKRIQCDLQYIRQWSLWMDVKILFRTISVVLSRENAY